MEHLLKDSTEFLRYLNNMNMIKQGSREDKLFLIFLASIFLCTVILAAVSTTRGFDWTDEAWVYSLSYSRLNLYGEVWTFHYITGFVNSLLNNNVLLIRILRLVIFVVTHTLIAHGVIKFLHKFSRPPSKIEKVIVYLVFQLLIMFWSQQPRTLAYNEMTSTLISVAVALILLSINSTIQKQKMLSFSLGALLCLIAFSKIIVFPLLLMALLLYLYATKSFWRVFIYLASGFIVMLLALSTFLMPIEFLIPNFMTILLRPDMQDSSTHPIGEVLASNVKLLIFVFPYVLPVLIGFSLAYIFTRFSSEKSLHKFGRYLAFLSLFIVAFYAIFFDSKRKTVWLQTNVQGLLVLVVATFVMFLILKRKNAEIVPLALLLYVIPFIGAAGTLNSSVSYLRLYASTWFVLIIFAWFDSRISKSIADIFGLHIKEILVLVLSFIFLTSSVSMINRPYRDVPMLQASKKIDSGYLKGLSVSEVAADYLKWISVIQKEFITDSVLIVPVMNPGIPFFLGTSQSFSPWLYEVEADWNTLERACSNFGDDSKKILVFVPETDLNFNVTEKLRKSLIKCKVDFPASFKLIDKKKNTPMGVPTYFWITK